ncbi:MAG: twin-arginine translocase subunit TatC [Flavobacteriales bacterium]|nr:twin-arginine translocase subunit TatC [Flavobacteriales bacterium]
MALDQVDVDEQEKQMSFLDHLEELRWHIIRSVVVILILSIVAMINYKVIFDEIIFGILQPDFPLYTWFCKLSYYLYDSDKICMQTPSIKIQNISVSGTFTYFMTVGFVAGFVAGIPYVLWEFWRFLKPALKPAEQKKTTGVVLTTSFLFLLGVAFGYYVLTPLSINFFINFQPSQFITNEWTLASYTSIVTTLPLASGLVFELPLIIYFLAKLGLISSEVLKKYRRHAFLVILILCAIITPPDVASQILMTIPVYMLFEIGISLAQRVEKQRIRENEI